jgi:hypothetical protein
VDVGPSLAGSTDGLTLGAVAGAQAHSKTTRAVRPASRLTEPKGEALDIPSMGYKQRSPAGSTLIVGQDPL